MGYNIFIPFGIDDLFEICSDINHSKALKSPMSGGLGDQHTVASYLIG